MKDHGLDEAIHAAVCAIDRNMAVSKPPVRNWSRVVAEPASSLKVAFRIIARSAGPNFDHEYADNDAEGRTRMSRIRTSTRAIRRIAAAFAAAASAADHALAVPCDGARREMKKWR